MTAPACKAPKVVNLHPMQRWDKEWDEWVEEPGLRKWDPKLVEQEKGKDGEGPRPKPKSKGPGAKRGEKRKKINDIAPQEAELPGESGDPVVSQYPLKQKLNAKAIVIALQETEKRDRRIGPALSLTGEIVTVSGPAFSPHIAINQY